MKCLIIEDDQATAEYMLTGLADAGHAPVLCQSGVDGLRRTVEEEWDVVILDRMLPGGVDGLNIVEHMRALERTTPVLVVSALTAIDERIRGLRAGGDDYLSKPFAFSELLARVEALVRRAERVPERRWLRVADLVFDLQARRAARRGIEIPLQPRELRLLEYLMRHEGQLITRTMLLENVWDCHFEPQTNVVNVQISRLRGKVDRGFSPALIHTVRGAGYRFGPDA